MLYSLWPNSLSILLRISRSTSNYLPIRTRGETFPILIPVTVYYTIYTNLLLQTSYETILFYLGIYLHPNNHYYKFYSSP